LTERFNTSTKGGFARLVPEMRVNYLELSLAFWRDLCRFEVVFERPRKSSFTWNAIVRGWLLR